MPLLPVGPETTRITSELVQQLDEELPLVATMAAIRVELPAHLRTLARIGGHEVRVEVAAPATVRTVLDAIEAAYPTNPG